MLLQKKAPSMYGCAGLNAGIISIAIRDMSVTISVTTIFSVKTLFPMSRLCCVYIILNQVQFDAVTSIKLQKYSIWTDVQKNPESQLYLKCALLYNRVLYAILPPIMARTTTTSTRPHHHRKYNVMPGIEFVNGHHQRVKCHQPI